MDTNFVKYHVACPECGSSDAVSVNEDGSAKCFSCGVFMQDYSGNDVVGDYARKQGLSNIEKPIVHFSSDDYVGVWGELTDRKISADTAQKYGVRIVVGSDYKNKNVIGSSHAKKLLFFERIDGYSTTQTIQHINSR